MKILVVEDSLTMCKIIGGMIATTWPDVGVVDVHTVDEARQALAADDHGIGLILLDCNLPGASGLTLMDHMAADERLKEIPVLVLSADLDKSLMIRALRAGARGYLTKPFEMEDLRGELARFMDP